MTAAILKDEAKARISGGPGFCIRASDTKCAQRRTRQSATWKEKMGKTKLFHKVVLINTLLVLGVGLYGFVTDEFYFRAGGHWTWLYNYLFGIALALNAPSTILSEQLAGKLFWFLYHQSVTGPIFGRPPLRVGYYLWPYLAQYGFWLLSLRMQWRSYLAIAAWCRTKRARRVALFVIVGCVTALGCFAAYEEWKHVDPIWHGACCTDRYGSLLRYACLTLTGVFFLTFCLIQSSH